MKVLVTGAAGQLGREVCMALRRRGDAVVACDLKDFDLTDEEAVLAAVRKADPSAIVHCAAYTAVDRAETEPALCCRVNGMGTLNIVRAALAVGARLVYVSTDYVLPGAGDQPQPVNAAYGPLNVYGQSKQQGEEAVRSLMTRYFIVRTSWLFSATGDNFVKTMLKLGAERSEVKVVNDQIGSPTGAEDLAALLAQMVHSNRYGIYHATNEGFCSWAEFAGEIMRQGGRHCRVKPISSAEWPSAAHRPLNSRLSKDALDAAGFDRLPPWQDALARVIAQLNARHA